MFTLLKVKHSKPFWCRNRNSAFICKLFMKHFVTTIMAHKHTAKQKTLNPNLTEKLSLHPKTSVSELQAETSAAHKPKQNHSKLSIILMIAVCITVTEYH